MVAFAIFASITLTAEAPQVSTVSEGVAFVRQLLLAFIFGFAIATGISLLILPITNRRNFFMGAQKYAATIESILEGQKAYLRSHHKNLAHQYQSPASDMPHRNQSQNLGGGNTDAEELKAKQLKSTMVSLIGTHDKLHGDLAYAKNEVAWGKLTASDLEEIFSHLRALFLPLAGLSMLPDTSLSLDDAWKVHRKGNDSVAINDWKHFAQPLMDELTTTSYLVIAGMRHSLLVLDITHGKGSKRWFGSQQEPETDVERTRDCTAPGSNGFASYFQEEVNKFFDRQKGLHVSLAASEMIPNRTIQRYGLDSNEDFFVSLFAQNLFQVLLQATLELVKFANTKLNDGTMGRNRIIFPQGPFVKAWLALGTGSGEEFDAEVDGEDDITSEPKGPIDPEHLPPANAWERGGNVLRYISRILSSDESVFGFRAAAASFSVAILAFLHQTQDFFTKQRLIWALIVIAFGMSPTSGAGLFSFAGRILATAISLVLSLIIWYIVDGHIAGVIVFLYLANVFEVKRPPTFSPVLV